MSDPAAFVPVADHALLVEFATELDDAASEAVVALDRALAEHDIPGVVEVVPALVNLLVDFDPRSTTHADVEAAVRELLSRPVDRARPPDRHVVRICFEGDFAPDLERVAAASGSSVEGVIEALLAGEYRVAMYGFAPGCAYLTGVVEPIRLPRKSVPVRGTARPR